MVNGSALVSALNTKLDALLTGAGANIPGVTWGAKDAAGTDAANITAGTGDDVACTYLTQALANKTKEKYASAADLAAVVTALSGSTPVGTTIADDVNRVLNYLVNDLSLDLSKLVLGAADTAKTDLVAELTKIGTGLYTADVEIPYGSTHTDDGKWAVRTTAGTSTPGSAANWNTNLTSSIINKNNISVMTTKSKGGKAISDVSLNKSKGYIEVEFVDSLVQTSDLDFEITVYLKMNSKNYKSQGVLISGTLTNDVIDDVDGDWDYIDLSDGNVMEASEYVRNLEIYAGNELSIFTNVQKSKKVYAYTDMDPTDADDDAMSKYPSIDSVINLNTNITSGTVKLDYGTTYYVYDADMKYLGKSNEDLPFAKKYYLSTKELDVTTGDDGDDGTEPVEEEPDDSTSTDETTGGTTGNNNSNPDTGANGFVNVAVAAAIVSLAAAGAVARKRK